MSPKASCQVGVVKAGKKLLQTVDDAMEAAGLGDVIGRGTRVLVKPNLHGGNGHTSEAMMTAACRWAFDKGARQVLLADGAYWGIVDATAYFEQCGVYRACETTGATPLDLHYYPYKLHHPGADFMPAVLGVSRHLYECDVVLNLPVMKTHFHTLITIALKNVKGCLRRVDKRRLHECDLNRSLGVVNAIIQPQVHATLCDATRAWEGMGPSNATPVDFGLVVASSDPVALDVVCCELMRIDHKKVRLIQECAQRGVGESNPARIEIVGEALAQSARRFKLPHEALNEQFPGLRIESSKACSCCMQNVFLALERAHQLRHGLVCKSMLIGAGEQGEAELLVGNCAAAGQGRAVDVPGCPPTKEAIHRALVGK